MKAKKKLFGVKEEKDSWGRVLLKHYGMHV